MENLRDQIIALADELRGDDTSDDGLGFVETGSETEFVFLNRTEGMPGYMLDEDGNSIPLPGEAMAGYIEDVFCSHKTHEQFGLRQKLRVVFNTCTGRIVTESGFFTNASKSILAGLAEIQDPDSLVTIEPSLPDDPDESPNVLFAEVYENGERISDSTWPHEDEDVIDLFYQVREDVFGLEAQDVEPQLPDRSGGNSGGRSGNSRSGNSRNRSGNGNGRNRSSDSGARSSNRRQSNRRQSPQDDEMLA